MTGDTDRATHAFREELTLCRELLILPSRPKACTASRHSPRSAATTNRAARLAGSATAHRYDDPEDGIDARLTASEPTHGTPPPAKAPHSAARTRSPTPSTTTHLA
jgi:hypothetical protein